MLDPILMLVEYGGYISIIKLVGFLLLFFSILAHGQLDL